MIKYALTAMGLKAFSATPQMRRVYRELSNTVGPRSRAKYKMPSYYFCRVNRMLRLHRTYGFPKDGDELLELGTGWLHWEAITARLFFDIQAVLYDVWDYRQLGALKNCLRQLDSMLIDIDALDAQKERAHHLIGLILKVESFEHLYDLLDFEYIVDPNKSIKDAGLKKFDVIVSAGHLEHVREESVHDEIQDMSDLLKPGGYSSHTVNIRDHLRAYDNSVSPKQYLAYSERAWKVLFENELQYINRMQRSDWLAVFGKSGLVLIEEEVDKVPVWDIKIGASFRSYDLSDLSCAGLRLVHRKAVKLEEHHEKKHLSKPELLP